MNSIPLLSIKVSYSLIKRLCPTCNLLSFESILSKFSKAVEKYDEKILEEISATFGSKWKEKDIFVYPLPEETPMPSIAFPLLLKLRKKSKTKPVFSYT